jgi:glycosyltransferase involved in cell wall biosynthesis
MLVHVSQADAEQWRRDRPDLRHEVIENGCDLHPRRQEPDYSTAIKQLLFVGSLSAQMNRNALGHFARAFWPELRSCARLRVVGSNPPPQVTELCRQQGWELRANVTEAGLGEAYADAHYAILPFAYGAGSKLKLYEAAGRGLPVLSTTAGVVGVPELPRCVQVADSAPAWRAALQSGQGHPAAMRAEGLEFARRHAWPQLASRLAGLIRAAEPVNVPNFPA